MNRSWLLRVLTSLAILVSAGQAWSQNSNASKSVASKSAKAPPGVTIYVADVSESTNEIDPPSTMLAGILHQLDLQRLSDRPSKVAVVVLGPDGITVFAGDDGLPTTAHTTLRQKLIQQWPAPAGATPLDMAFETISKMLRASDPNARKVVVWSGDGQPDSAQLRPNVFPAIAEEMEKQRATTRNKYKDFPDQIVQEMLTRLEREWELQGTEAFESLYPVQLPLEFKRTLEIAAGFKSLKVRLVTLDFAGGLPALKEIHEAGGGLEEDLLVAPASEVIRRIGDLNLHDSDRVLRQKPIDFEAQTAETSAEFKVNIPNIADKSIGVIEFHPALPDFHLHALLTCEVDGVVHEFTEENESSDVVLAHDAKGNVATASVFLSRRPDSGEVVFALNSPDGKMTMPACTVYSYVQLRDDLVATLRPRFVGTDVPTPYSVSPQQQAEWICSLRADSDEPVDEAAAVEVVFTDVRTGQQVRIDMTPDPAAPGQLISSKLAIPAGQYDARVFLTLKTGVQFSLALSNHVNSRVETGVLLLDYPVVADPSGMGFSEATSHIAFPDIGDELVAYEIPLTLRSQGSVLPVEVVPRIVLFDSEGTAAQAEWLQVRPQKVKISPNDSENIKLTVQLPKQVEEGLIDGLFTGSIDFEDPESGLPTEVKRFRELTGVDPDIPVNRITFTLHRPKIYISCPRCFREWITGSDDAQKHMRFNVSIGKPFERTATFVVWHDSGVPRRLRIHPPTTFRDKDGREVPPLRFVPLDEDLEREVLPGETTTWTFNVEIDESGSNTSCDSELIVVADQLKDSRIQVRVVERPQLLSARIQGVGFVLSALTAFVGIVALRRRRNLKAVITNATGFITKKRPLKELLSVSNHRKDEIQLQSPFRMTSRRHGERIPHCVPPSHGVALKANQITATKPTEITIHPEDQDGEVVIRILDANLDDDQAPEVEYELVDGNKYDTRHTDAGKLLTGSLWLMAFFLVVAIGIHQITILRASQWVFDWITGPGSSGNVSGR